MLLTFDEVLQSMVDGRRIRREDVPDEVLFKKVWVAEWHLPGCLSETSDIMLTKADAINTALSFAETENGFPRGMRKALEELGTHVGPSKLFGTVVTTISKHRLGELID